MFAEPRPERVYQSLIAALVSKIFVTWDNLIDNRS